MIPTLTLQTRMGHEKEIIVHFLQAGEDSPLHRHVFLLGLDSNSVLKYESISMTIG